MRIKLKSPNVTLKTKDKYCTEDITIELDESLGYVNTLKKILDATKSAKYLFYGYKGDDINNLICYSDTENVENMEYMFGMTNITTPLLIDTHSVTNMSNMFYSSSLQKTHTVDTSSVTNMSSMFRYSRKLIKVDITHFYTQYTSNSSSMFEDCVKLKAVIIRSFGDKYILNSNTFTNAYYMLGTYHYLDNPNSDHDGYIYCPREYISILQNETNWSKLQFRALEDYTLDGTTTGEFDDEKAGIYYD